MIRYYFKAAPDSDKVKLKIMDKSGKLIKTYQPKAKNRNERLSIEAGMNRFAWNMRYPNAEDFPGMIMWAGSTVGPKAVPGNYQARLVVAKDSMTVNFEIQQDPRSSSSPADLQSQFDFLIEIRDKLTETHQAIKQIRDVRSQVKAVTSKLKDEDGAEEIKKSGKELVEKISKIEETLYQTKNQSRQDPLNFPIRLNNKLAAVAGVASAGDFRPTDQAIAVKEEITDRIDSELARLRKIINEELPAFNDLVHQQAIPAVMIKKEQTDQEK